MLTLHALVYTLLHAARLTGIIGALPQLTLTPEILNQLQGTMYLTQVSGNTEIKVLANIS